MRSPYDPPKTRTEPAGDWRERALCAQIGGDYWYPDKGQTPMAQAAVKICRQCPVRAECLTEAVNNREQWGIWGGTLEKSRQRLRAQQARQRQALAKQRRENAA